MVSVDKVIDGFSVSVDLKESIYSVACMDSGIGKSYGSYCVKRALDSEGKLTLIIDHTNYNNRMRLLESAHFHLIIIDEVEQYDDFDLNEYISYSDNVWYISRRSINPLYENKCKIAINGLSVKVWEVHNGRI